MLERSLESLPTQIDDDALFEREALRLVHDQRTARDNRELFASLARAFIGAHFGQAGHPLRLARIEGGAAILQHHDKGLGKVADRRRQRRRACRVPLASPYLKAMLRVYLLAAPYKVKHPVETIEGGTGLPFSRLCASSAARGSGARVASHPEYCVRACCCSRCPHLRREVPSIQVMLQPFFVIATVIRHEFDKA